MTGGGGGIGRATAISLARSGYDVVVADQDVMTGEETANFVERLGRRAMFVRADVSEEEQVAHMVEVAWREMGGVDGFANNAGIEGMVASIQGYPTDVFDKVMAVNVRGIFLGLKFVLPMMRERGKGSVVNTASTSAIRGRAGLAGYVASKHAVLGLTRVAALEVAGSGLRVNAVLPGPIDTRMIHSLSEQAEATGTWIARSQSAPMGRPEDVADTICFLLSERSRHVNGAAWVVDGGTTVL